MAREIDEAWIDEAIERYRRIDVLRAEFDKAVPRTSCRCIRRTTRSRCW